MFSAAHLAESPESRNNTLEALRSRPNGMSYSPTQKARWASNLEKHQLDAEDANLHSMTMAEAMVKVAK